VTLLDAITRAEGLSADAGPDILLTVRHGDVSSPEVRTIPVRQLIDAADPAVNVELTGGEEVRVPEARKIYVVGNVKRPGAFPLRDASGMTVLKILAVSEGLLPFASKVAYIYRKADVPEGRQEVPVDLDNIVKRKSPDVSLEPEDVFYIPDNNGRRTAATILDRATGFGVSTASGMLIWRR
jgi:polysaccharide export outer membrane protein